MKRSYSKILLAGFCVAFLLRFGFTYFFPEQEMLLAILSYVVFLGMLVYSFVKRNKSNRF